MVKIDAIPRDYAWGSTELIADFRNRTPSGRPEAELWLGTHPAQPTLIRDPRLPFADLASWLQTDSVAPTAALVPRQPLPFLLKLLAAAEPLSLQAHPSRDYARESFQRENNAGIALDDPRRNYRDPNPKPELIVALSETFDALSGFRKMDEVRAIAELLEAAATAEYSENNPENPTPGEYLLTLLRGPDSLRASVTWLLEARGTAQMFKLFEFVQRVAGSAVAKNSEFALSFETVLDLAVRYPGDPGVVISLLLNRVRLNRGESLYLAAGNIHAYLTGLGIELMTASDNVLRGGLTEKHIDPVELLRVLDFTPGPPPRLSAVQVAPGVISYRPDADGYDDPGFCLHHLSAGGRIEISGPVLGIAEGLVQLRGGLERLNLSSGEALFITADEAWLEVSGAGSCWFATLSEWVN